MRDPAVSPSGGSDPLAVAPAAPPPIRFCRANGDWLVFADAAQAAAWLRGAGLIDKDLI